MSYGAVLIQKDTWAVSSHHKVEASVKMRVLDGVKVLKKTIMLNVEHPFTDGEFDENKPVSCIVSDNDGRRRYEGKFVSLHSANMAIELTGEGLTDGIDNLIKNIK